MDVVFWAVLDVSAEMVADVLGRERIVMDVALDGVVFGALIGQGFQQCGAARARATEYHWRCVGGCE
jgi:hypothetical protein